MNAEERATIMLMRQEESGLRAMGRFLKRYPSTIAGSLHVTRIVNLVILHHRLVHRPAG
ncbi:helix-turn-helix domain-containing protein [Nitrosomonas sp.]|uniref:helix-turn-helix domain-containing protein n=1 Tax=Nitrosomonas sp. TaxID=42353 RepID=UPI0034176BD3